MFSASALDLMQRVRVRAMLTLVAHPERAFAAIAKRYRKGLIRARLVATAPPASKLHATWRTVVEAQNTS